ncbi:hypothetical protein K6I34_004325 [Streptomyces sp. UNOC14_S4]|nr:hypothetical protein [Streptomyces sp. UNOC14_S4]
MSGRRTDADEYLVRIRDLAGRPRGTGFLADDRGTMITSHEAVDGLARLVLLAPGDRTCLVGADAVTPLPGSDLALVRTEGLGVAPLPVAAAEWIEDGVEVRLRAGRWQSAKIIGEALVTYTATDRFHLLDAAVELSIGERDGLRLGEEATGGPVLDARTGTVTAVLGTALHAERRSGGFAIPLRAAAGVTPNGPLAALLERNAATIPAYGRDLNLAGALQLTATSLGTVTTARAWRDPVPRPEATTEFERFLAVPRRPADPAPPGLDADGWAGPSGGGGYADRPYEEYGEPGEPGEPGECGEGAGPSGAYAAYDPGVGPDEPPDGSAAGAGAGDPEAEAEDPPCPPLVLGLVGGPGTGRTTELGALASRRARGPEPAPTIWLRGADLRDGDESVRDAVARALEAAAPAEAVTIRAAASRARARWATPPTPPPRPSPPSPTAWGAHCSSSSTGPRRSPRSSPTRCPPGRRRPWSGWRRRPPG